MRIYIAAIGAVALVAASPSPVSADGHDEEAYIADLSGDAEVPGPGDPDGTGTGSLDWNEELGQFCYALAVENIGAATAAHLHRGAAGEAGPPVLTLAAPGAGGSDGCVDAGAGLRREIGTNPAGFYFNIHNEEYPAGAIRGQLER